MHPEHPVEEEETPWLSFSDAMTALLFVFIATTFWFMFQLQQAVARQNAEVDRLTGANTAAGELLAGVGLCLTQREAGEVRVRPVVEDSTRTMSLYIEPRASTIVEWFQPCSAEITPDASQVVDMVRDCLADEVPALTERYTVVLTLEGHTDARQPGGACLARFPSNWELSGARSGAALRRLLCEDGSCDAETRVQADALRGIAQDREQLQLVAAGRADSIPAWRALCDSAWSGAKIRPELDQAVCASLDADSADREALRATIAKSLTDAPRELDTPDLALIAWANDPRCITGEAPGPACDERFRRLRRVDMRVDLRPR